MRDHMSMTYQYRCGQCRTTSLPVYTHSAVAHERRRHRDEFHGGHVPDGEAILEPEPFRLSELPRNQLMFGVIVLVALVIAILIRVQ